MQITEIKVSVRELTKGYKNNDAEGVIGYDGKLDIRPKYQREFVYNDVQRDEVIRSVKRGLPLNVFYWAKIDDDHYEVLDGQQRTVSLCEYVANRFALNNRSFSNLTDDEKNVILDYKIFVYICDGTESEKLEWFKIINIAGEQLTAQELRNAVYAGSWLSDAKKYFSKPSGSVYQTAKDYMKGSPIRQEYLETALKWASRKDNLTIEGYMGQHMNDATSANLWSYFYSVIAWVKAVFPTYRKEMKGLDWAKLYDAHHEEDLDPDVLETEIARLMGDEDVTHKAGIYDYVLNHNERVLSIRSFDRRDKLAAYEAQDHRCAICQEKFEFNEMQGDHKIPWSKGGKTVSENCQMLCKECNLKKSNK